MVKLESLVRRVPKAELHIHLEGAIQPKTALRLAKRNNVKLPFSTEKDASRFYKFENLSQFLEIFSLVGSVLKTSEDFATIVTELGADSARQNILYREVFFSYTYHERRGIPWDTVVDGLSAGCKEAKRRYNVEVRFIASITRSVDSEAGVKLVELADSSRDDVPIIGIGLSAKEAGYPPERHKRAFKLARELGFHRVAHAGEETGPEYIWRAIRTLNVERVDHGYSSVEDDELLAHLAKKQIPLTLCPVSATNVYFSSMAKFPFRRLVDAGLFVTINSDDPAMFSSDLNDNYLQVAKQFKLGPNDIEGLALNSFKAAFLEPTVMKSYEKKFCDEISKFRDEIFHE